MTWTHEGKPLGQPQRPWRLTRAQRVEMEAALVRLRRDVTDSRGGRFLAAAHWIMQAATYVGFRTWEHNYGSRRALRARVAIALRAALRADEDARCDAMYAEGHRRGARLHVNTSEDASFRDGATLGWTVAVNAGREWPGVGRGAPDELGLVPLALWEIDERRRRETVRAVVALLTWGLS